MTFLLLLLCRATARSLLPVQRGVGSAGFDFALARYNSDGSPDATFGIGGKVTTDFLEGLDSAHSVVVQGDGKIVAAGLANEKFGDGYFALARYNSDGGPDASFGFGGMVTTGFSGGFGEIGEMALQCDGKIVAAGIVTVAGTWDGGLVRYNSDGSVDAGFGNGGTIITDFLGDDDFIVSTAIQSDGKILIGDCAKWRLLRFIGFCTRALRQRDVRNGSLSESSGILEEQSRRLAGQLTYPWESVIHSD